jgi:phosphoribosylpyrophosphate synthetase
MALRKPDFHLFALNASLDLARKVCAILDINASPATVGTYANKETKVEVNVSVRGKDVFIIQSGIGESQLGCANNSLMELLMFAYHCKTACARKVVAIIPYLHYSTQSKMRRRSSIPAKLVASMLCRTGIANFITVDLHSKEIQGFYSRPVDNLRASPFLTLHIKDEIRPRGDLVIVALNPHTAHRASPYAERLRVQLAVLHGKVEDDPESDNEDDVSSPAFDDHTEFNFEKPPSNRRVRVERTSISFDTPGFLPKSKPSMYVVGDVVNKIAVIVNDLIDDANPYIVASHVLKSNGAKEVYVVVTHGILSGDSPEQIESSDIDGLVMTNTVEHEEKKKRCRKFKTIDVSGLLSEAIRRIHNGESIGYLFRNISVDE